MHAEWDGTYGRRVTTAVGDGEFLNSATVIDCFSRRLAGWSIADHMRTSLVTDALRAAAAPRGSLAGAVFHSDHGAQGEFTDVCAELGVRRSMGAVGMSADNALAESFNGALKRETLRGARASTGPPCRLAVFRWTTRYNTRRRHSANGHQEPIAYEQQSAAPDHARAGAGLTGSSPATSCRATVAFSVPEPALRSG